MEHESRLVTAAQAAGLLGLSRRTIHRMASSGALHTELKLGGPTGAFLFARAEVESLAAQRKASQR